MIVEDTIAAPATAPGDAGVAILRLSGPRALSILAQVFRPAAKGGVAALPDRYLAYGDLYDSSDPDAVLIDQCLAVTMRGPRSFTGEDVVEIHCHGGQAVVAAALDALMSAGARLAEPGEFSRRAFLNGRMDLSQAEALGDLIGARTQLARRLALRQLRGGLSDRISALQSRLIDAAAHLEAHLDFPDEDVPAPAQASILAAMNEVRTECGSLLGTFNMARLVRDGARVVLAGQPNAGKSSIFNALLNRERAIVSPHPGTTRDTIEATVDLAGVPVTLVDTAGLREATDDVERIGIERSAEELRGADLVLHVIDATEWQQGRREDISRFAGDKCPVVTLLNKWDLTDRSDPTDQADAEGVAGDVIAVSATTRTGFEALEASIANHLVGDMARVDDLQIIRARHADCLRAAVGSLGQAHRAFEEGISGEFVMVDLRDAILFLGDILGERLDEQILDRVFSTFCLGK